MSLPTLTMLHGWGLNSRVWDAVLPRLSRRFKTVRIDLPGHGGSPWPPAFEDIDSLADLLAPRLETGFLLGWSLGSMAALALAAKHPALAHKLVLVASTPKFLRSAGWPNGVDPKALEDMAERVLTDFEKTVRDFLMWQVYGEENARQTLRILREKIEAGGRPHPLAMRAGLETLAKVDLRPRLPGIRMPALVVSGERDRLSHPLAGRALADALPDAKFHLIAHAAHAPFLSHEEEFCTAVEAFLTP